MHDQMSSHSSDTMSKGVETAKGAMEGVEGIPSNVYLGGVAGSILASALLMMMGRRNMSIFVGLWPPTILNLAMFAKQLRPSREVGQMQQQGM